MYWKPRGSLHFDSLVHLHLCVGSTFSRLELRSVWCFHLLLGFSLYKRMDGVSPCRRGTLLWHLLILVNTDWLAQQSHLVSVGANPAVVPETLYRMDVLQYSYPIENDCLSHDLWIAHWVSKVLTSGDLTDRKCTSKETQHRITTPQTEDAAQSTSTQWVPSPSLGLAQQRSKWATPENRGMQKMEFQFFSL